MGHVRAPSGGTRWKIREKPGDKTIVSLQVLEGLARQQLGTGSQKGVSAGESDVGGGGEGYREMGLRREGNKQRVFGYSREREKERVSIVEARSPRPAEDGGWGKYRRG